MKGLLRVPETLVRPDSGRRAIGYWLVVLAVFWGITAILLATGVTNLAQPLAPLMVAVGFTLPAGLAALATWGAYRRSSGLEARTWRGVFVGTVVWALGGLTYILYVITGGDPLRPAAWSQVGFLAAYLPWYRALWRLRQPMLATSRIRQAESFAIELATLLMLSLVVGSLLWNPAWPAAQNIAQLVPPIFDLLLLALFYGAVRRGNVSSGSALKWLGYAFSILALSDIVVTFAVIKGELVFVGLMTLGYLVATLLLRLAAIRPLRIAEAQNRVRSTIGVVAVGGLTLAGLAVHVAPDALKPTAVVAGAFLCWRAVGILSEHGNSDTDVLTGFLEPGAFTRHLGGVIQQSTSDRPSLLLVVDIDGFGAWNSRNGYQAGDAMLVEVAQALESSGPDAAAWGRLKADRFALTTVSHGLRDDRGLAELLRNAAAHAAAPLTVRAAIVQPPHDVQSAAEALDAADEALRAASEASRPVVAFAGGELDGISATPGNASLSIRRQRIQEIIAADDSISIFLQPVMSIRDMSVHGYEALSRFHAHPPLRPDQWIAEATVLGLGVDLDVSCARRGWHRQHELDEGVSLSINVSPEAIVSDQFTAMFAGRDLTGIIFEVTEHERVANYPRLAARLAALRGRGAKIAIDDTGAGHASLSHLIELKPEFIKLDRGLVSGLDVNSGKHALVRNMLRLADDLGAQLVAEGIETQGELWALRGLGVPLGQGYLLGRPAPYPDGLRTDADERNAQAVPTLPA